MAGVVRLKYGDYQQMSVYDMAPSDALAAFSLMPELPAYMLLIWMAAKDGHPGNAAVIEPLHKREQTFCRDRRRH